MKSFRTVVCACALVASVDAFGPTLTTAAENAAPPNGSLLITGPSIVRPEASAISGPSDLLISDGKIVEIAPAGEIARSRAAEVYSAAGRFVLPGLIDVHTHFGDGGLGVQTTEQRAAALERFLPYGVTTILNLGGGGGTEEELRRWKRRCLSGELRCPDVYGTGVILTAPGGHPIGTLWEMPKDVDPSIAYARGAVAVAESDNVGPLLERKLSQGVDAVKIAIEDWDPEAPVERLSARKVTELARGSHKRGLKIFAHVSRAAHIRDALTAGVDGVVHSAEDPIPDTLLAAMAKREMFYVPTLALYDGFIDRARGIVGTDHEPYAEAGSLDRALDSLADFDFSPFPSELASSLEQTLRDNLRRADAAGVPLALGTDVNNPSVFPGYSAHEELELMVAAGLSPARALAAATTGNARFLGREETLGQVAPGFEADLLILQANPLENILNTRSLTAVVHDGRVLDRVVTTATDRGNEGGGTETVRGD